jgi:hypothetical protein
LGDFFSIAEGRQPASSNGQLAKANSPIVESLESGSNVKLASCPQSRKQDAAISRTDDGIQIAVSLRQKKNAHSPSVASVEPGSNEKVASDLQRLKQDSEMASTDEGIPIERRCGHFANADFPRLRNLEPGSKVTLESQLQPLKQQSEIVSTDEGTQIEASDESENAPRPKRETVQTGEKETDVTRQRLTHPSEIDSIAFPIVICDSFPKYPTMQTPLKSTMKSPSILTNGLAASIAMLRILDSMNDFPRK